MRALVCREYGPPSTLRVEEIPSPLAGPGELVLNVRAAGVNFPDVLMIMNKYQHRPTLPFSPGYEIAGVVKEVGPGVNDIKPGDYGIAIIRAGGFAEEALVEASRFFPISAKINFDVAAAFPLAYGTSLHALSDRAILQPGQTLVVLGASGGVGLAAVQIGKLLGAKVIACASSPEKLEICKRHGADHLINYATEDVRKKLSEFAPSGVDIAIDPVGGALTERIVRSMAWGGCYLIVGFSSGEIPSLALNLPLLKGCAIVGVAWDTHSRRHLETYKANMSLLADWIRNKKLRPALTDRYSLTDAPRALESVLNRQIKGKAVVIP